MKRVHRLHITSKWYPVIVSSDQNCGAEDRGSTVRDVVQDLSGAGKSVQGLRIRDSGFGTREPAL